MAERSTPPERPQPPAPARRSTEPLHYPAEQLQDEQSSYLRQESPDYDHGAIGRGRGRSRFSPANREDHAFAAPTSALSATQKKDIRAMNYSASSWPAALPDEATAHPYATAAQPDADYAHPQETNPAITLGSPFKTPPPNQTDFTHENGPARDVSLPPAAPERGVRPRHPPVSGSTTVVTGRGRSASAGSSNSAGGVNKDKILQELAAALEKERKKGKALGSEIVKGEEEIDSIRQTFEAFKAKQDAQYSQHQAIIAALQLEIDHISKELETAYDLSPNDAATYLNLLTLSHPNLDPRPSPITSFSQEALNKPNSPVNPFSRTRKLSKRRSSQQRLLERQLSIAQGRSPAEELNGERTEPERGRESVFRRVARAVSRSRSRSRTRGAEEENEEVKVAAVAEDGKSRPPVAGWGARGNATRTRSNSLTKALKGVGKAMFPSNAPPATRTSEAVTISAPLQPAPTETKLETENIHAWIRRSQAELARKGPPTRAQSTPLVHTGGKDQIGELGEMNRELGRVGL